MTQLSEHLDSLDDCLYFEAIPSWCASCVVSGMSNYIVKRSKKLKFDLLAYLYEKGGREQGSVLLITVGEDEGILLEWCKENEFTITEFVNYNMGDSTTWLCTKQIPTEYFVSELDEYDDPW